MKHRIILLFLLATIIAGSVMEFRGLNRLVLFNPGLDKILHSFVWFGVIVLIYLLFNSTMKFFNARVRMAMIVATTLAFSFILESAQGFIGGRSFEVGDVLANLSGIVLGTTIMERKSVRTFWLIPSIVIPVATLLVLVENTKNDYGHYMKGLSYQHEKEYVLAKEQFLLALEEDLKTAQLYNDLAWLNLELLDEDLEASHSYARSAVSMSPDNADYIDTLGWALYRLGRNDEALASFLKAYDLDPTIYCINYHLGLAYLNIGDKEKALFHLQKQKKQTPGDLYDRLSDEQIKAIGNGLGTKVGGK